MIEGQPSVTAQQVAIRRAVGQLVHRPLLFEDPLAPTIVGSAREQEIHAVLGALPVESPEWPSPVGARTRSVRRRVIL